MNFTEEQLNYFYYRTNLHISFVKEFGKKLLLTSIIRSDESETFLNQIFLHDSLKFEYPEFEPYVLLTWKHKCKNEGIDFNLPEVIEDTIKKTCEHHVNSETHHPEYWDLNKNNNIVDARGMDKLSICTMVCDWCAMSKELNNNPFDWADNNINIKWKFSDNQVKLIYRTLNEIWY